MGLELVDSILKTLRQAQEKRVSDKQVEIQQGHLEELKTQHKDQLKLDQERLKNEKAHQDAQIELARKAGDLIHAKHVQDLAEKAVQGVPIAGDTPSPAAVSPTGGGFTPINPNQA